MLWCCISQIDCLNVSVGQLNIMLRDRGIKIAFKCCPTHIPKPTLNWSPVHPLWQTIKLGESEPVTNGLVLHLSTAPHALWPHSASSASPLCLSWQPFSASQVQPVHCASALPGAQMPTQPNTGPKARSRVEMSDVSLSRGWTDIMPWRWMEKPAWMERFSHYYLFL